MSHHRWSRVRHVLAGAVIALVAGPALGQGFTPDPVDQAAAKREGKVVWYTSTPIEAAQKIARLFQEETGINVELFRSGGSAVLRRFTQEIDAGRVAVDVLTTSDPAASALLAKRGIFVPFKPRNFDKIPDEGKDKDGHYVAQRLNMLAMFAREDKVSAAEMPKAWTDLTDRKYKGKMVMPDPSFTALQLMVVGTLSKKYGWDFYEKLRTNDTMIVQGHQQVSDMLKRGERVIAAEGLDSYAYDDRKAGHKIATIYPSDGTFAVPSPTAVIKGGPHPNAAKAFAEFMIGDKVQTMFPEDGHYAARVDMKPPEGNPALASLKLMPVDYDFIERETRRIKDRFNEIFQ
ncbi:MAG: extracellular solute-binding protein [Alphaproteobacteria bacterium]|nr:extracellular solute-binding protein [Alphaproteobacteria bacterium]